MFHFFCPPRGVEWLFLQLRLVYSYLPVLQNILLFYSLRKAAQDVCIHEVVCGVCL